MRAALPVLLSLAMSASAVLAQSSQPAAPASLDYEYFKNDVQPIFLTKRPGHARCVACHAPGTPLACSRSRRDARPGPTRSRARTSKRSGEWWRRAA